MPTMETIKRIYGKAPNEFIEIGMDADTGELVEIRFYAVVPLQGYKIVQRIIIEPESIDLVIQALESFKKV